MKKLMTGLANKIMIDEKDPKIEEIAKYLRLQISIKSTGLKFYQNWAVKFFICECLNFVNVIGQIYFIDTFLEGEFLHYGTDVLKFHFFHDHKGI